MFSIEIDFIRISCLVLSFTDSPASGTSHTTKVHVYFTQIFVLKMGHIRSLFSLFSLFQTNITIFTTNICEKMPIQ